MDISNTKLTHGLLIEDFKQSISNVFFSSPLDIQTKTLVLDCLYNQVQKISEQQTQKEFAEYNAEQRKLEQEEKKQNESQDKEVSE